MFEKTRELLDHFEQLGIPGYDLLVLKDGNQVLRWRYGYSDCEKSMPVNGTERYNLYSCSKRTNGQIPFTNESSCRWNSN